MSFLAKPLRLGADDMVRYVLALPAASMRWSPVGVVWHNAALPDLKIWASYSPAQKENWGANYDAYCKTTQRWHSGPHAMGTPEPWSFVLCDLAADGVHDSCRNHNYYGVETVGNFAPGADDPSHGDGLAAMKASANIIAALCKRFGWEPSSPTIDFHRNCARDGHPCPGARVTDAWAIGLVKARLAEINGASPAVGNRQSAVGAAPTLLPTADLPTAVSLPVHSLP